MFADLLSALIPTVIKQRPRNREFFKKLTSQELDVHKLQTFLDYQLFFLIRIFPTINDLRVEVTANNFGKMQHYFPLFDRTDIVLDQWHNRDKQINKRLPYYA